jgi:hypothetical protein
MDIKLAILNLLVRIGNPIRIPTARWLISDVLGVLDSTASFALGELIAEGRVQQTNGGWLNVGS